MLIIQAIRIVGLSCLCYGVTVNSRIPWKLEPNLYLILVDPAEDDQFKTNQYISLVAMYRVQCI